MRLPTTFYKFGPHTIPDTQVFYKSKFCLGLVNLKPIVPRVAARVNDLHPDEAVDMMLSAQKIGKVIENYYSGTSLSMVMQDGPEAGQTVPHVHMHVIPRKAHDYANNDDIYDDLDKRKAVDNEERQPRTEDDMAEEADKLRVFFDSYNDE
ncbi:hypothetical protein DFQ28_011037 [Apophysomyces sp. BC1034]|nr:hypothetical protein DFQ29_005193 [Apophysomyces sp. BC1021]KAG0184496.1 hypothetical protein DFQ28_011037 [Apophysomyces sp. BC1034]